MSQALQAGRYQRVSSGRPCAICGKTHWCLYDPISGDALCCRADNGTPKDQRWDGWHHAVEPTPQEFDQSRVIDLGEPWAGDLPDEEAEARDLLTREMARLCPLSDGDRAELKRRGLDDTAIAAGRFFTYPPEGTQRNRVMSGLERYARERDPDGTLDLTIALWRLPGVYSTAPDGGGRSGYANRLAGRAGLAIPVPDTAGRYIAVQIRGRGDVEPRYTMLSTKATPSHAPPYVARPGTRDYDHSRVLVTEGAFKAIAAAKHYNCIAFGLPGIGQQKQVVPALDFLRQRGKLDPDARVFVAFDEEPGNPRVAEARDKLTHTIAAAEWHPPVSLLRWDGAQAAKLDDALAAGLNIDEEPVTDGQDDDAPAGNGKRGPSIAQQLIALADVCEFFHDEEHEAWVTFPVGTHQETTRVNAGAFWDWLEHRFHTLTGRTANAAAKTEAQGAFRGRAKFEGNLHRVYVRLAEHEGVIYLDLADEARRAVKITAEGWEVVQETPVKFWRPKGMLPLAIPTRGGTITDLSPFVNVTNEEWPLLVGFLIGCFRAAEVGGHPVLPIGGEQGSAKSTLARIIRRLIDPNRAPLRAEPSDKRDIAIAAQNSRLLVYDNLSGTMQSWLSNSLCRISTGGGYTTRALYTDADEMIFDSARPIVLTSIADVASKSDLVDRAIFLSLPRIKEEDRRDEVTFWRQFAEVESGILGALLTAVSTAIKHLPSTNVASKPRMADFAKWVIAAESALGWEPGTFLGAYGNNRAAANKLALDASLVGQAMLDLIPPGGEWKGTCKELLAALEEKNPGNEKKPGWPQEPRGMSNAIRTIAPNLRAEGFTVPEKPKKSNSGNVWTFTRAALENQESPPPLPPQPAAEPEISALTLVDMPVDVDVDVDTSTPISTPISIDASPEISKASGASGGSGDAISIFSNGHAPGRATGPTLIRRGSVATHPSWWPRVEQLKATGLRDDLALKRALAERGAFKSDGERGA